MNCKKKAHNHSFAKIMGGVAIVLGVLVVANMKDILRYIRISSM